MWEVKDGSLMYDGWYVLDLSCPSNVTRYTGIGKNDVPFPVDDKGRIILGQRKEPSKLRKITVDGVTVTLWSDGYVDSPWSVKKAGEVLVPGKLRPEMLCYTGNKFLIDGRPLTLSSFKIQGIRVSEEGKLCSRP